MHLPARSILALALTLVACDTDAPADAAVRDAATRDAGSPTDAGARDAAALRDGGGRTDAGDVDAASRDAGTTTVVHGRDIGLDNTGFLAWRGPAGETCTEATMTVYDTEVRTSTLGGSATCAWFQAGIRVDAPVTLTACRIDGNVVNSTNDDIVLEYCLVESPTPGDWALGYSHFSATRCQLLGSSDGVRFGGSTRDVLIENYIRTREQDPADHNDGVQMYGATGGGVLLRNNIDARPVGGGGGPNAALFIADDARGEYEIRDNYLLGGGFTLRLHESGTYRVTGNRIETGSYAFGPLSTTAAVPGAFLEWSDNYETDGTELTP